jgi:CHASE1-domain containing sensor protein
MFKEMGITYFTLGVLSMMGLIFVGLVVVGLVKVFRLEKNVESIRRDFEEMVTHVHRRIDDINQNLHRKMDSDYESIKRHRSEDFKYLEDKITKEINECNLDCKKYTDKRFDKNQK